MSDNKAEEDVAAKGCPFCGSAPKFERHEGEDGELYWWLGCKECVIAPYLAMDTKEDCINYWNIREGAPHE